MPDGSNFFTPGIELCASSSAKGRSGKSWEKGKAYSQTPEARLRQPEALVELAWRMVRFQPRDHTVQKPYISLVFSAVYVALACASDAQ